MANNATNAMNAANNLAQAKNSIRNILWQTHTKGKQTAAQLAEQYQCSRQTIIHHLKVAIPKAQFATSPKANIIMDAT